KPFIARLTHNRGELKTLAISLTGSDKAQIDATIVLMSTPLRTWMGFGYGTWLQTCFHGSRGRMLATDKGAQPPLAVSRAADSVRYQLPQGMKAFKHCCCGSAEGYLITKGGLVTPVVKVNDNWIPTQPLTLREAKGSSGAPLVCKCRGVKGMFLAARTARGMVTSVRVLEDLGIKPDERPQSGSFVVPPPVGKQKEIIPFVAPTGSGKTTKLPKSYYDKGYHVLVLNPSVATTISVGKYMKDEFGISPNVRCGDYTSQTGSRLSYMTYGMFLATQCPMDYDVIICDECHSTDGTTVLGIGGALAAFADVERPKLLLLATATPPGTGMVDHPNIKTIALTDEGDFPFHGKKIKLDRLRRGRHLIFEASKKHCDELARDLEMAGITAVSYYRGKSCSAIPPEGDVVVVATDALMTGYSGNFDSVYDCCLAVEGSVEVDMCPTFTVGIQTKPACSIKRMQRRGRTGRGREGFYYPVTEACTPGGIVPDASIYEAFDSGRAYFGLTVAEVARYLDYYKNQTFLPIWHCETEDVENLYATLPHPKPSTLDHCKEHAENFPYLHAVQLDHASTNGCMAPNSDPVWRPLKGKEKFFMLYRLGKYEEGKTIESYLTEEIEKVFCNYYC
nr:nonstructural protein NS3 [Norway rat hepacivirus 2]